MLLHGIVSCSILLLGWIDIHGHAYQTPGYLEYPWTKIQWHLVDIIWLSRLCSIPLLCWISIHEHANLTPGYLKCWKLQSHCVFFQKLSILSEIECWLLLWQKGKKHQILLLPKVMTGVPLINCLGSREHLQKPWASPYFSICFPMISILVFECITISNSSQYEQNKWKIRLQLTKPVTWPPLIWGVLCGAAASGDSKTSYA